MITFFYNKYIKEHVLRLKLTTMEDINIKDQANCNECIYLLVTEYYFETVMFL